MRFLPAGSIILTGIHALIYSTLAAPASQKGLSTRADSAYNLPSRTFPSDTSGIESSQVRALVTESIEGGTEASGGGNHHQARAPPADEENASESTRRARITFVVWGDEDKKGYHNRAPGYGSQSTEVSAPKDVNDLLHAFLEAWLQSIKPNDQRRLDLIYMNGFYDVLDNGFIIPNKFEFSLTGVGNCRHVTPAIEGKRHRVVKCLVKVEKDKITLEVNKRISFTWAVPDHLWYPGKEEGKKTETVTAP
ncbi:hypothetical protein GGU10DRAFT_362488 [Lentinula aff. detonsa]|uniref:Uncharacterized protein n=1 Tax=Lentinula aff. detonsa TaxID=2804958 RepID=A0AA38K8V2_9AGAR|nr:hypothetical protein GGU10DRAFT_362488 [Lentinula aff. detonsa]